jgi:hypothetical protein
MIDHWWRRDPLVMPCIRCGCPIQDGPDGDGMTRHLSVVHPDQEKS